ncbi:crotonase/enoyl-CoA hydratase family protein [Microbacterium sp. MAHUQ-60]|uniref:crotonase/enoyl-CoA hydratase family protein n=1 Tax=unclassified Microbacterium TaxID=2609290 RepID=UPI0036182970
MGHPVAVERDGHVETWTLNLPEQRNPITGHDVIDALEGLVDAANDDVDVRVVILTGAGSAFSTGGNVRHMIDGEGMFGLPPAQQMYAYRTGIQRIPRALARLRAPIIAAVNGPAVGAGCDLVCMCDLRIASTNAWFAESFVKLGIIPGDGGAWLLPRAIGDARAREMAFTGDRIDAQTALEWGLVSQVVEPDELLPAARALAARIAVNPPLAVRMTKQLIAGAAHQTLDEVLDLSAGMQALAHQTEDHRRALEAARDRRVGEYRGR